MNYIKYYQNPSGPIMLTNPKDLIKKEQLWLAEHGYYNKAIDGIVGQGTIEARKKAEKDGYYYNRNTGDYRKSLSYIVNHPELPKLIATTNYREMAKEIPVRQKADKRNKSVSDLLELLWRTGMFLKIGVTDYNKAVDGVKGNLTNKALEYAKSLGYNLVNGILTKRNPKEIVKETVIEPEHKGLETKPLVHTPITEAIINGTRGYINKGARTIANDKDFTLLPGYTITSLPDDLMEALKEIAQYAVDHNMKDLNLERIMPGLRNRNYATGRNGRTWLVKAVDKDPISQLENTIGSASYHYDNDGNLIVTDTYDFNDNEKASTGGTYEFLRNEVLGNAVKSSDPDKGKNHYNINLGRITKTKKA